MKPVTTHRPEPRTDLIKSHNIDEHRHDPYKAHGKLHEPTLCKQCKAVFVHGRWQWADAPKDAHEALCPACHRVADKFPAGEVKLSGGFVAAHAEEIIGLVRNIEKAEQKEHALQRIMGIDHAADRILITTTDIHLPRRIAHAVESAYGGHLETHYDDRGYFVRIAWTRDA